MGDFFAALIGYWGKSPAGPTLLVVLLVLLVTALVGLIGAVISLVSVIGPRVTPHSGKKSVLFFQTIAEMPCDEFVLNIKKLDSGDYAAALCDQTYNNSKVVAEKFKKLSLSVSWFWIGVTTVALFSFLRPLFIKLLEP